MKLTLIEILICFILGILLGLIIVTPSRATTFDLVEHPSVVVPPMDLQWIPDLSDGSYALCECDWKDEHDVMHWGRTFGWLFFDGRGWVACQSEEKFAEWRTLIIPPFPPPTFDSRKPLWDLEKELVQ